MYDEMWVTGDGRFTIRRLLCAASPHLNLLPKGEETDRPAVMTHAVRLLRPCRCAKHSMDFIISWLSLP